MKFIKEILDYSFSTFLLVCIICGLYMTFLPFPLLMATSYTEEKFLNALFATLLGIFILGVSFLIIYFRSRK